MLFAAAAAIAQVYTYSAYGELLAIHNGAAAVVGTVGQANLESLAATNKLYNGEGFDTRTGLYNFRARNCSASLGRFERLDPFAGNPTHPFSLNKCNQLFVECTTMGSSMLSVLVCQLTSQAHWTTILRVRGSVGIDSLFKALKGVDFSSPIIDRGIARSLADYRPDVVAIQDNVLTIVEVGSPSQMSGTGINRSYAEQLQTIQALAGNSLPFEKVVIKIVDVNGNYITTFY